MAETVAVHADQHIGCTYGLDLLVEGQLSKIDLRYLGVRDARNGCDRFSFDGRNEVSRWRARDVGDTEECRILVLRAFRISLHVLCQPVQSGTVERQARCPEHFLDLLALWILQGERTIGGDGSFESNHHIPFVPAQEIGPDNYFGLWEESADEMDVDIIWSSPRVVYFHSIDKHYPLNIPGVCIRIK